MIAELAWTSWALLGLGALIVGLSKTALPGSVVLAVALFAAALPAKASTGALLVLLIVGDLFAVLSYRRHADWRIIARMAPAVVLGLAVGGLFLAWADDGTVRRVIGVLLLAVIGITLWRRSRPNASVGSGWIAAASYGGLGGFATMVANAAGPVMSMYFYAARVPKITFLGTTAWFFAMINLAKLPFSVGLGIITPASLLHDLVLLPLVVIGALLGRMLVKRISQQLFDRIVVTLTVIGALYLLI